MKLVPSFACVLLLLGVGTARSQSITPDSNPPMRVMSDTPEFCSHLVRYFDRVKATRAFVPPDSLTLADEGQRMCEMGHVRAGIARLRLAFTYMRGDH